MRKARHLLGWSVGRTLLGDETGVYHLIELEGTTGYVVCNRQVITAGMLHKTPPDGHACGTCLRVERAEHRKAGKRPITTVANTLAQPGGQLEIRLSDAEIEEFERGEERFVASLDLPMPPGPQAGWEWDLANDRLTLRSAALLPTG